MVNGAPSSSAGPSSSYPARLHAPIQHIAHNPSAPNVYNFSVHQPYANWPPPPGGAPYTTTWYMHPHHAYGQPQQTYKDEEIQTTPPPEEETPERSPTPVPFRRHWDSVVAKFLKDAGLGQALRGFGEDMTIMNEDWEHKTVPIILKTLLQDLLELAEDDQAEDALPSKPLDKRKLEYICPVEGTIARTPSTITKSISRFLGQSRNRNDASNRAEFLKSIAEKRGASAVDTEHPPPSCARVDAKTLDRDVQMKYDIAKNEDGPLKRTMRNNVDQELTSQIGKGKRKAGFLDEMNGEVTAERHPGLAERFTNIESHLSVRYVPSPPHSLLDRIRFLEDHIMDLEKSHPPWSALHFNQPNRGWPPPPRTTPIIVPSHLTSHRELNTDNTHLAGQTLADPSKAQARGKGRAAGTSSRAKSSLHRAVMERLEVKKAMDDLAGVSEEPG